MNNDLLMLRITLDAVEAEIEEASDLDYEHTLAELMDERDVLRATIETIRSRKPLQTNS